MGKALLVAAVFALLAAAPARAQLPTTDDPRANLAAGFENPGTRRAGRGLDLANRPKPAGFFDPANPGAFGFLTSDMAFEGDHAFVGGFNGFQVFDIANPSNPTLTTAVVCPGGQGDMSVYGNLLFMSVEDAKRQVDCGTDPAVARSSRGVRIFDISNLANPVQVAAVQTCRGSHTHTLVETCPTRTTSTSTCPGHRPAPGPRPAGRLQQQHGERREPVAVADRGHQGAGRRARRTRPSSASRGCSPNHDRRRRRAPERGPDPAAPVGHPLGRRRRSPTRATTSRSTRSSTSPPAPVRATAC